MIQWKAYISTCLLKRKVSASFLSKIVIASKAEPRHVWNNISYFIFFIDEDHLARSRGKQERKRT